MPTDRTWTDDVPPGYIPPGCGCGNLGQCAGCAARTAAIWTDGDIAAVRPALAWHFGSDNEWLTAAAAAVLDAAAPQIAARIRAEVAEEIAQAIEAKADAHNARIAEAAGVPHRGRDGMQSCGIRSAAAVARTHATTEEATDAAS